MRVRVVCGVTRIEPYGIKTSVWRYRKCAKPVPLVLSSIIIHAHRPAEALAAVGAAHEHDICPIAVAGRLHAGHHVNVVVRRAARPVNRQKQLAREPCRIDVSPHEWPAKINLSNSIEGWRYGRVLGVARTKAPKRAAKARDPANKNVAVRVHIECSPCRRVRHKDRTHPRNSSVRGAAELSPAPVIAGRTPSLIQKAVSHPVRLIYCEPLLVASTNITESLARPRLPAIC